MSKVRWIVFLGSFMLVASAAPLWAKPGNGNGWGQGEGGGRFHKNVPEIDPSLAPSALALLAGGMLILRSKLNRE